MASDVRVLRKNTWFKLAIPIYTYFNLSLLRFSITHFSTEGTCPLKIAYGFGPSSVQKYVYLFIGYSDLNRVSVAFQ